MPSISLANNVDITNVSLTKADSSADTINIQFDISWENSWRNQTNYDAVWVFAKYTTDTSGSQFVRWNHAKLKTAGINPEGFSRGTANAPEGYGEEVAPEIDIIVPEDRGGCFIQRSSVGFGTVDVKDVEIVWSYGEAVAGSTFSQAKVRLWGIEMVYIASGDFYIGDGQATIGGSESNFAFHGAFGESFLVTNTLKSGANAVKVSGSSTADDSLLKAGIGVDGDGGLDNNNDGDLDDAGDNRNFPVGYNAFYAMKYELSQAQYRGFLNSLLAQYAQTNRTTNISAGYMYVMSGSTIVENRQVIRRPFSGPISPAPFNTFGCDYAVNGTGGNETFNESTDGEWIAMNYIKWQDLCAYADWACLRPMTETEFEKVCRGPGVAGSLPAYNTKPWGTTDTTKAMTMSSEGQAAEVVTEIGKGLAHFGPSDPINEPEGPLRCGFAATSTTDKFTAGSSYYGVMELAGNLYEMCVTLGNTTGRSFQGTHGDGLLFSNSGVYGTGYEGDATNSDWPGYVNMSVNGATGNGRRGGSWADTSEGFTAVSDRRQSGTVVSSRASNIGGRLVRTAPTQPS